MREIIVRNVLVTLNILMWISGWVVLAISVHMMIGNHARYYTAVLLGSESRPLSSGPHHTPSVLDPGWLDTPDPQLPDEGADGDQISSLLNTTSADELTTLGEATNGTLKAEGTLLVAGAVVVVAGLLGCIASSQKDKTLLLAYGCLMIASGTLEAGVGIWCFIDTEQSLDSPSLPSLPLNSSEPLPPLAYSGGEGGLPYMSPEDVEVRSEPERYLKAWYGQPGHAEYTRVVDYVQERLSCCGLSGPRDYVSSMWLEQSNASLTIVPRSCCLTILPDDGAAVSEGATGALQRSVAVATDEGSWRDSGLGGCAMERLSAKHSRGCLQLLPSWVKQNFAVTGAWLLIVAIFQISGAIATIVLRREFKSFSCREMPPIETLLF